ncbi:MAG TPA: triose-phosphate isomerase [Candidatus Paceibacterota bacterium]|nr:triose-phosphate isomerase [Candidatus Paceibacterota bacterium]
MAVTIVANWKMHPQTKAGARVLVSATKKAARTIRGLSVIIAAPSIFLAEAAKGPKSAKVAFAAQDIHFEKVGAFTGETSAWQAKDVGAAYTLIGHSERRAMGETDEDTRKKVAAALAAGLKPILCVGEKHRDSEGEYLAGFSAQLMTGLADVPASKLKAVSIAYEPVWAIGGEKPMSPNLMHETSLYIRKVLSERFGKAALSVPILYGGSITEQTAREMMTEGEVQGLLVGHVSVDPVRFATLLKSLA